MNLYRQGADHERCAPSEDELFEIILNGNCGDGYDALGVQP